MKIMESKAAKKRRVKKRAGKRHPKHKKAAQKKKKKRNDDTLFEEREREREKKKQNNKNPNPYSFFFRFLEKKKYARERKNARVILHTPYNVLLCVSLLSENGVLNHNHRFGRRIIEARRKGRRRRWARDGE